MKRRLICLLLCALIASAAADDRPNVVFVITDDQGYGDLGFTGNPIIQTPHLDHLAEESVWLQDYHVAPSCSPTRSALLTGRWTNRTGVWHTFFARAMMYEDEVTIADHFQAAGYSTGMFGKWHLGDHFPYRPQDRGFDEVFCLKGGAIGVTADYWNNDYFDDSYYHNEEVVQTEGYCTDVFFDASSRFIRAQVAAEKPFFAYISTNAPHKPWVCPPEYSGLYPDQPGSAAAFYGMVTNIDENVGKLRALLDELGVTENTIFIFTTDNGSVGPKKFNAGMRAGKISPYEGGHRVPFALHWPKGGYAKHTPVPELTHMTDVLPTLLDLCDIAPAKEALDGRSFRQLLNGNGDDSFDWEGRTVISDSQRIQTPRKWKDSSVMTGKWRLVKGTELYHIGEDPGQANDVAALHPERVAAMREWYENWWAELEPTFSRTSEIYIGADEAPEVALTALQWIDAHPPWNQGIIRRAPIGGKKAGTKFNGHWAVNVVKDGFYTFEIRRWPEESGLKIREGTPPHPPEPGSAPSYSAPAGRAIPITSATLRINGEDLETKPVGDDDSVIRFTHELAAGSHKLSPFFTVAINEKRDAELGAYYLTVSPAAAAEPSERPNIVLINADDLGYGDLSCYGATKLQTPNIDRLANEGRRFTDAHSASAVCTPSRYGLLTGRYPFRRNLTKPVFLKSGLVVDPDRTTIADVMKDAGYATACIGKWHLGFGEKTPDWNGDLKPGPLELGFDRYYGVPVVNSHPPFVYVENYRVVGLTPDDPLEYNRDSKTQVFPEKMGFNQIGGGDAAHALYRDEAVGTHLTEKAVDWIEQNREAPFFLYLATTNIHHPFTPAERFKGTSECGLYGDFVHELDWIVGEVMATLEKHQLADNTLVIFTSDNGGMINQTGQDAIRQGHQLNGDLLGFKFDAWEGGHRVPFIARWPGKIEAGSVSDQLISQIDLMRTFASLTGQQLLAEAAPDSVNMLEVLTSDPAAPIRTSLVTSAMRPTHLAYREGNWVLIDAKGGGGFSAAEVGSHTFGGPPALAFAGQENSDLADGKVNPDAPAAQLYHLGEDRGQRTNVIRENPEIAEGMRKRLERLSRSEESPAN